MKKSLIIVCLFCMTSVAYTQQTTRKVPKEQVPSQQGGNAAVGQKPVNRNENRQIGNRRGNNLIQMDTAQGTGSSRPFDKTLPERVKEATPDQSSANPSTPNAIIPENKNVSADYNRSSNGGVGTDGLKANTHATQNEPPKKPAKKAKNLPGPTQKNVKTRNNQ